MLARRWLDEMSRIGRTGAVLHRMAVVALVVLQEEGELGFITRSCVPDLHGGSSNTAGRQRQSPAKSGN